MKIKKYEKHFKKIGLSLIGIGTAFYLLAIFVFHGVLLTYLFNDPLPPLYFTISLFQDYIFMVGILIFFIGVPFLKQSLSNKGKEIREKEELDKIIKDYNKTSISLIITGFIILALGIIGGWIISSYLTSLTSGMTIGLLSALLWFYLLCVGIGIKRASKNISRVIFL